MIKWAQVSLGLPPFLPNDRVCIFKNNMSTFLQIHVHLSCHNPNFTDIKLNVKIPWTMTVSFILFIKSLSIHHIHNKF